ncbi:MAG: Mut7-C RNAse domain-containing protein [Candidatus Cloacimonetes bacterium]|nr:Mut7-C RNAse domain-containing protein [Candidatus Cloacimonadota bacterium]
MREKRKKYLLDENLGKLAKWLRVLGFDAAIYKSISPEKKIDLCLKEQRVYLTRSKKLSARKEKFTRILIKSDNCDQQLRELGLAVELDENLFFTRCINCNKILKLIDENKVINLVPKDVHKKFTEFKTCTKCGRIYWAGSHYQAMFTKIKNSLTS